jgi:hypothetical protein
VGRLINPRYALRESRRFSAQCEALGGAYRIDQALAAFYWVLERYPETYPVLPGLERTRLVTTHRSENAQGVLPRLRLYFQIEEGEDEVLLLWIEEDLEMRGYEEF